MIQLQREIVRRLTEDVSRAVIVLLDLPDASCLLIGQMEFHLPHRQRPIVREQTSATEVPSLEAELIREFVRREPFLLQSRPGGPRDAGGFQEHEPLCGLREQ